MKFSEAFIHMMNGSKVRLDSWDKREYISVKNGLIFKHSLMNISNKEYEVEYFWSLDQGCEELLGSWSLM